MPQEEGHRGEGPAPFGLVGAGSGVGSVAGAKDVCGAWGIRMRKGIYRPDESARPVERIHSSNSHRATRSWQSGSGR